MTQYTTREQRRNILRPARMRADGEWCDITICNVSSRGFMAKCISPPCRGTYVEVRHRSLSIVARVVWSRDARFGVRAQDKIDIPLLLAEASAEPQRPGLERRASARNGPSPAARRASTQAKAEASRRFARAFEWASLALAVAVAAGLVFELAANTLGRPMRDVKKALSGSEPSDPSLSRSYQVMR